MVVRSNKGEFGFWDIFLKLFLSITANVVLYSLASLVSLSRQKTACFSSPGPRAAGVSIPGQRAQRKGVAIGAEGMAGCKCYMAGCKCY